MTNEQERPISTDDIAGIEPGSEKRGEDSVASAPTPMRGDAKDTHGEADMNRTDVDMPPREHAVSESDARSDAGEERDPLLPGDRITALRERWLVIQGKFVDEPREAVEQADSLVAEVIRALAEDFAHERSNLERQWDREQGVGTEDLRVALRHYRSFMERLLAA